MRSPELQRFRHCEGVAGGRGSTTVVAGPIEVTFDEEHLAPFTKRPGKFLAAFADCRDVPFFLRLDDRDDLVRTRIDDDNLVADQDVVVAPPLGIDCEYSVGQRV